MVLQAPNWPHVTSEGLKLSAGCYVPDTNRLVVTGTRQSLSIWTEVYGVDGTLVSPKGRNALSRANVPDSDHRVLTSGSDLLPIRAEGHRVYAPGMFQETSQGFSVR